MKEFEPHTLVRSKLKAHTGQRGRVLAHLPSSPYNVGPDETLVNWLIDTPEGDWSGGIEVVKTRNLVEIRKVVTVTWVDVA